jgi:hypothetical protein
VIAFQEQGFRTYVQFTHEVWPAPEEKLWRQMRDKTRNVIRRAEERLRVKEMADPEEFVHLFGNNLHLRGLRSELDLVLCKKTITAALARNRGRILAAYDKGEGIVAASVCVWDDAASYYLLSTRTNDAGNGAVSLLIWESIKESARRKLVFDFAGLGTHGSVLLYSGFGATVTPRYVALRTSPAARLLLGVKALFTPENFYF